MIWCAQAATELRHVVGDGVQPTSQGPMGVYYDGQVDWSDGDWFDGLGEPMSRDADLRQEAKRAEEHQFLGSGYRRRLEPTE